MGTTSHGTYQEVERLRRRQVHGVLASSSLLLLARGIPQPRVSRQVARHISGVGREAHTSRSPASGSGAADPSTVAAAPGLLHPVVPTHALI